MRLMDFDCVAQTRLPNHTLLEDLHRSGRSLVFETCRDLDANQRRVVEGIYRNFRPLIEVSLTADQVQQVFQQAEKSQTAAGGNRTLIGRGVDTAKAVDNAINKVGRWLADTTPVKAFDKRFADLKTKVSEKFPALEKNLTALGTWAKENPGKTAAVIGVLTTLAALAGGPAGGAIAGQILRGTTELIKGEKLSTAVGKGLKTAAYGALAGATINQLGDAISGGAKAVADNIFPGAARLKLNFDVIGTGGNAFKNVQAYGRIEDVMPIKRLFTAAGEMWSQDQSRALQMFQQASTMAEKLADPSYVAQLTANKETASQILASAKNLVAATDAVGAAAQGAIQGAAGQGKTTTTESRQLSRRTINEIFVRVQRYTLLERGARSPEQQARMQAYATGDTPLPTQAQAAALRYPDTPGATQPAPAATQPAPAATQPAPAATEPAPAPAATEPAAKPGLMSRIGKRIGTIGQNLTTKITADKLNTAWKRAGSPTDSEELAQVLKKAGVGDDIISSTFQSLNIPTPSLAPTSKTAPASPTASATPASPTASATPASPTASATPASPTASASSLSGTGQSGTAQKSAGTTARGGTQASGQGGPIYQAIQRNLGSIPDKEKQMIIDLLQSSMQSTVSEEKDACYRKVKSRYKVWPSAYASGALVQCRKQGAANWGNKGKK